MLSSLIGQPVRVLVAHLAGNGDPPPEALAEVFAGVGLNVTLDSYADLRSFELRGITRTKAIQECTTEWILFSDSDMVYHPCFFRNIDPHLTDGFCGIMTAGRWSQPNDTITSTNAFIDSHQYPRIIPDAFRICDRELPKVARANVGAGFFQLCRTAATGGYYVTEEECADWRWSEKYQKGKADGQFRRRMKRQGGKKKLPDWYSQNQIHLNHDRDKDAGRHLETQR